MVIGARDVLKEQKMETVFVISGASGPIPGFDKRPICGCIFNIFVRRSMDACPLIVPSPFIFGGRYDCNQRSSQR